MRRLVRFLLSRTVAIALMLAMAFFLALSSLVPEPDLEPERLDELRRTRPVAVFLVERLHPSEVARSPGFVALAALVFLSTAFSVQERVRAEIARRRRGETVRPERFRAARTVVVPADEGAALEAARDVVGRGWFRAAAPSDAAAGLYLARGQVGFAGSIVFHVGLLVVMAGIAVSARTRANGELLLVEGHPTPVGPGTIVRATRPEAFRALAGATFAIRDFTAEYDRRSSPVDFAAIFDVRDGDGPLRSEVVRVNQGISVRDFQFTLYRYGFAPELSVRAAGGRPLAEGTAILTVIPPGRRDRLALDDGSELDLAFFPDLALRGGEPVSRSLRLVAPALDARHLVRGAEEARAFVRLGRDEKLGGLSVRLEGVRYWADFQVSRDLGLPWVAIGSALVASGLALRFLFDPRTVTVSVASGEGGTRVELTATARWFPALNEERASALAGRIAERLGGRVAA